MLPRSPTGWHYGRSSSNRRSWTRSKAASRLHHPQVLRSIPTRNPPRTKGVSAPRELLVSWRPWWAMAGSWPSKTIEYFVMADTSTLAVARYGGYRGRAPRSRHPCKEQSCDFGTKHGEHLG